MARRRQQYVVTVTPRSCVAAKKMPRVYAARLILSFVVDAVPDVDVDVVSAAASAARQYV